MSTRRKAIPLHPHEVAALKELYLVYRTPIDQYERRPRDLSDFMEDWNVRMGRRDTADDIIHKMKNERKAGRWPVFGGDHKIAPPSEPMSAEEIEVLVAVYDENIVAIGHCSDVLSTEPELADTLAKEFAHRARRRLPASVLIAQLTALRKRGLLPVVGRRKPNADDCGFADIGDVAM